MQTIYLSFLGLFTALLTFGVIRTFSTKGAVEFKENEFKSDLNLSDEENRISREAFKKQTEEDLFI